MKFFTNKLLSILNKISIYLSKPNEENNKSFNIKQNLLNIKSASNQKKVFDCFIFDNEIDLLLLRFKEYYEYIDYFIIVEIASSHTGNVKLKSHFEENKNLWKQYENKIIFQFVPYNEIPFFIEEKPFIIENFHRNYLHNLLLIKANHGDIILLSDVDEFWEVSHLDLIKKTSKINIFIQNLYYYYFNCKKNQLWAGTIAYPFGIFLPQDARAITIDITCKIFNMNINDVYKFASSCNNDCFNIITNGGSHFSWLLNKHNVTEKFTNIYESNLIKSFFTEKDEVIEKFKNGLDFLNRKEWQHKLNFIPCDSLCQMPRKLDLTNSEYYKTLNKIKIINSIQIFVIHSTKCIFFTENLSQLINLSNSQKLELHYIILENKNFEIETLNKFNIKYSDLSQCRLSRVSIINKINIIINSSSFDNFVFATSDMFVHTDAIINLKKHHNGYNIPTSRMICNENKWVSPYNIHCNLIDCVDNSQIFEKINHVFLSFKYSNINYGGSFHSIFIIQKQRFIESGGLCAPYKNKTHINKYFNWCVQSFFTDILRNKFHMNQITVFDSLCYKFDQ